MLAYIKQKLNNNKIDFTLKYYIYIYKQHGYQN
jgi:hypothetical protein